MGVAKPILSVSELNRTGHTVVFAPEFASITRGPRTLPLVSDNGVFYLGATLARPKGHVPVFPLEQEEELLEPRLQLPRLPRDDYDSPRMTNATSSDQPIPAEEQGPVRLPQGRPPLRILRRRQHPRMRKPPMLHPGRTLPARKR